MVEESKEVITFEEQRAEVGEEYAILTADGEEVKILRVGEEHGFEAIWRGVGSDFY